MEEKKQQEKAKEKRTEKGRTLAVPINKIRSKSKPKLVRIHSDLMLPLFTMRILRLVVAVVVTSSFSLQPVGAQDLSDERSVWETLSKSPRADDFELYLQVFPNGIYADDAKARLRAIRQLETSPFDMQEENKGILFETLPEGTRVYIVLKESLVGKSGQVEVGQKVNAQVWKDIIVRGNVLVKAGTPVLVQVEKLKTAKIAGVKGQISLDAYETKAVDGKTVQLVGGYLKEGKSRMAVSITLGVLFIIPIFITGDAARLPEGMVFDALTGPDMDVQVGPSGEAGTVPVIDVSASVSEISADVNLDAYMSETKPKYFQIDIEVEDHDPKQFFIDRVNGVKIDPIPLDVSPHIA